MKVKFQADADFNEKIVKGVLRRSPDIDFKTATEAGFEDVLDEDVLAKASDEGRVLVPHDRKTMPGHFADLISQRNCAGVIVVSKKAEISRVINDLILIWVASEAEEYINTIRMIPF